MKELVDTIMIDPANEILNQIKKKKEGKKERKENGKEKRETYLKQIKIPIRHRSYLFKLTQSCALRKKRKKNL